MHCLNCKKKLVEQSMEGEGRRRWALFHSRHWYHSRSPAEHGGNRSKSKSSRNLLPAVLLMHSLTIVIRFCIECQLLTHMNYSAFRIF